MKPRMVVHIGTHKTGTTTIQYALHDERARMRQKCHTLFASTERGKLRARHTSLAVAALGEQRDADKEYKAVLDEFERSGAKAIFFTDESLSAPSPRLPQLFKRFTKDFDVEVICYLRRWDYFLESLYNQAIRVKNFQGVPPITEFWRDERIQQRLDYHTLLSRWADIPAKMIVKDFRKEVQEVGLLDSFLDAAGLQALGTLKEKEQNQSHDMRLLLTLCRVNSGLERDDFKALVKGLFRAAGALAESGVIKPIKNTLGSDERSELIELFRARSEPLERDFGIVFSDERPKEGKAAILEPDADFLLALIGELSVIDALRFHKCAQSYLVSALGRQPEQKLLDATVAPPPVDKSLENIEQVSDDEVDDDQQLATSAKPAA